METAFSVADTARAMFIHYAMDMRSQCTAEVLSPEFFLYGGMRHPRLQLIRFGALVLSKCLDC
jgi:hypothetical protein